MSLTYKKILNKPEMFSRLLGELLLYVLVNMLNNSLNFLQTVFSLYYVMLILLDKFENLFKSLIELLVAMF